MIVPDEYKNKYNTVIIELINAININIKQIKILCPRDIIYQEINFQDDYFVFKYALYKK